MTPLRIRALAALVVVAVLGLGLAKVWSTPPRYVSSATLGVSPASASASRAGIDIGRAGTVGTFMQLTRSPSTLREARAGDVTIRTSAVTGTAVFRATAVADTGEVQDVLRRVVAVTERRQVGLRDAYRVQILTAPSAPALTSTPPALLTVVVVFFALLGGTVVLVLPGRLGGEGDAWALQDTPEELWFEATLVRIGPLTDSTSVVRISGRWHATEPRRLATPVLVVADAERDVELPPARLAGQADPVAGPEPDVWEGAYGIPAALFDRVGPPRLALRLPDGVFEVEFDPSVWGASSPDGYDERLARTSS